MQGEQVGRAARRDPGAIVAGAHPQEGVRQRVQRPQRRADQHIGQGKAAHDRDAEHDHDHLELGPERFDVDAGDGLQQDRTVNHRRGGLDADGFGRVFQQMRKPRGSFFGPRRRSRVQQRPATVVGQTRPDVTIAVERGDQLPQVARRVVRAGEVFEGAQHRLPAADQPRLQLSAKRPPRLVARQQAAQQDAQDEHEPDQDDDASA